MPAVRYACVFALAILSIAPVCAQVRYRSGTPHGTLWRRLYSQLPQAWKARGLVYVREISDAEMDRFVDEFDGNESKGDTIVDGCYQDAEDENAMGGQITLRMSLRGDSAALVFVHEYGHYVWSNLLTGSDRARYRRLWHEQKRIGALVTAYAGDSDEEGFAEAFAYYIRHQGTLRRADARSCTFLSDLENRDSQGQ